MEVAPLVPNAGAQTSKAALAMRASALPAEKQLQPARATVTSPHAPWQTDSIWGITPHPVSQDDSHDLGRTRRQRIGYLEGLRGFIAIEMLLNIFFRLLAPAIGTDTGPEGDLPAAWVGTAPSWQNGLRRSLGVLFWDSTLPGAFFIILSARVASLTFLERRTPTTLAGAVFRRPLRFLLPIVVALAITAIVLKAGGFSNADQFATLTSNTLAEPPTQLYDFLAYFNSIFEHFFVVGISTTNTATSFIPPSGATWIIPVIFQQTFTLYIFSALMPYVTLRTKLLGFAGFIIASYWVGSWAWFTLTGLQLAEFSLVYLPAVSKSTLRTVRLGAGGFLALGVALKYVFSEIPSIRYNMFTYHANMSTGTLDYIDSYGYAVTPYPRTDDYFVVLGAMTLVELSPAVQRLLDNAVLRFFGRISFMLFLTCGTICLALGSTIYVHLTQEKGWTSESNLVAVMFFACIPLCLVVAEVGYWVVEWPTNWLSRRSFVFLKE